MDLDSDAFFDQLLSDAGVQSSGPAAKDTGSAPSASPSGYGAVATASTSSSSASTAKVTGASGVGNGPSKAAETTDIESEYAKLSQNLHDEDARTGSAREVPENVKASAMRFDLGSDDDGLDVDLSSQEASMDCRPPDVPPAPPDFTPEDMALRQELSEFYFKFRPENLGNINMIVKKYRGAPVSHLWAQLAIKYNISSVEGINLLTRSLYMSSPFEYLEEAEQMGGLTQDIEELRKSAGASASPTDLLRRSIEKGIQDGSDTTLRMLCFRGIPDDSGLRPQIWKVLLGYLPMERHFEWNAIQGQKRALFESYKTEFLIIGEDHKVKVKEEGYPAGQIHDSQELLQEIQQDVDRTQTSMEYFRRPETRASLAVMLFIYARLNPGVRYVQGMNEVAAVMLHVMSADPSTAEADAFWCFNELMVEIKEGFIQALDSTQEGVHALTGKITRLLREYDVELAKHLQKCDLPAVVFAYRWCTVLFAQDVKFSNVPRLWDALLADPHRLEFLYHVAVSMIIGHREELLQTDKQFTQTEVLQSAPKTEDFDKQFRRACAICAFERRAPVPPFPPKSALQVVDDLSELAQTAAAKAQEVGALVADRATEVGAEMSRTIQETIAPAVYERAGEVSANAAAVASESAQKMQQWLEDTAPQRREAIEKAQTKLSSFWSTVVTTSAAVASKGHRLASEYAQSEAAEKTAQRFAGAADNAANLSSKVYSYVQDQVQSASQATSAPADQGINTAAAPSGISHAPQASSPSP